MSGVRYLIGNENILNLPMATLCDEVCDFLNDLSKEILGSQAGRLYPDLSALAFWCRKANIQKIKETAPVKTNRLGRGLCFHIAPSNIPVNFAFSYVFSLLAGNANIVRIPSKDFPQVSALVEIFKKVLEKYPKIKDRTAFVKYDRTSDATAVFSKIADARMIWGGDNTIKTVKSCETKPRCIDIAFADRYSVCIIDGERILEADENSIERLAQNFYNDTYLMDQNACSSPQLIYWQNDSEQAREKFWNAVYKTAKEKYVLQDAVCVDKYTKFCEDAIDYSDKIKSVKHSENLLYRSEITAPDKDIENLRGKAGYFYEYSLKDIGELFSVVDEKYQTVTYYGIDAQKLAKDIVLHELRGIDRIVPIGKAMDIDVIWDGYDLLTQLSRIIDVR